MSSTMEFQEFTWFKELLLNIEISTFSRIPVGIFFF